MLTVGLKGLTLPKAEHDALRLQNVQDLNEIVNQREKFLKQLETDKVSLSKEALELFNQALPFIPVCLKRIDPAIISELGKQSKPELKQLYDTLILKPGIESKLHASDANALLASDFFGAFGGFFDRRYREHDFVLGRLSGLSWLHKNCPNIKTRIPFDLQDQVQAKILTKEPHLKPSGWLRVARMALRALRILLIEARNHKLFWKIVMAALRYPSIVV